jgi:serine-type D-Ala-D-Ala carboxypeptidase (penicillin-binding protein 5/6)
MKRFLAFCVAAAATFTTFAQAPLPPEIAARNYILLDLNSRQVLAEREADVQADPASLTKLMTAYLVFAAIRDKKLSLEQTLPVSQRAWAERKGGGSLMFIDTTMTPKVDDLLKGMIVQSGNDASVVLAEAVGGTLDGFVAMMNKRRRATWRRSPRASSPTSRTSTPTTRSASSATTASSRTTATYCSAAIPPWTA